MGLTALREKIAKIVAEQNWSTDEKLSSADEKVIRPYHAKSLEKPWIKGMPKKSKEALIFTELLISIDHILSLAENRNCPRSPSNLFQEARDYSDMLKKTLESAQNQIIELLCRNKHLAFYELPQAVAVGTKWAGTSRFDASKMPTTLFKTRVNSQELNIPEHMNLLLSFDPAEIRPAKPIIKHERSSYRI